ncbi:DNA-directed RNA polymerase subunit delta [Neobacillus terrae]|uniref:DNA-directed RNA polymerase subunit delta n=1 Tax=Neobacillus terrae TaxID=3034837 RepID=UPI0014088EF9|nr:DNA-directed RNA polymerase subunit delta [Neobacillus terrae]NHM30119.1 DNA-directed RNA polymerase subunit delta [Neobacillus terrae]
MSLKQLYSKEQLQELSFVEMVFQLLKDGKQPIPFNEMIEEIKQACGLTNQEVRSKIAQIYTDLNIDGRFLALGDNRWGLRTWYPVEQFEEEMVPASKPKKKKAKKVVDEDDIEDFEDLEEDLEYDDLDDFADDEDDVIDDDDEEDDDLFEDIDEVDEVEAVDEDIDADIIEDDDEYALDDEDDEDEEDVLDKEEDR